MTDTVIPTNRPAYGPITKYYGKTNVTRIDHLHVLDKVRLELDRGGETVVIFMGIEGEGEAREAKFMGALPGGKTYIWSAYRDKGRWVWGSSADRMRLLEVLA